MSGVMSKFDGRVGASPFETLASGELLRVRGGSVRCGDPDHDNAAAPISDPDPHGEERRAELPLIAGSCNARRVSNHEAPLSPHAASRHGPELN